MEHDFASYQSHDTSWRYDTFIYDTENEILHARDLLNEAEQKLKDAEQKLQALRAKPPLYHLFNWSA